MLICRRTWRNGVSLHLVVFASLRPGTRTACFFLSAASCLEDALCPLTWEMSYVLHTSKSLRKGILCIVQVDTHDHSSGESNSGKIFTPQILVVAEAVVRETPNKQLTFEMFYTKFQQRLQDLGYRWREHPASSN